MNNLLCVLIGLLLGIFEIFSQTCNDGFESNSFSGWQGIKGINTGNYTFSITSLGTNTPNFGIETATIIPCSNSISNPSIYEPLPAFGFGQYSARLGEVNVPGSVIESLTYSFVPTAADTNFLYVYSTYLQAPVHGVSDNPYFIIGMLDQNGDTIPGTFYMYQTGSPSVAGFDTSQCGAGLYFKPWTIRGVNLSPYVGQTVVLFAVNADCYYGGHYAYSYIDMDCDGVLQVPSQSTVLLSAKSEAGSSYLWNTGATTPTIVVNNPVPNSIYTCKVTLSSYFSQPATTHTFLVTYKIIGTTNVSELTNNTLKIYPNPVSKDLNIEISANESIRSIEFFDITGSLQKTINNVNNNTINCSDFSDGIYFIRVLTDKGKVINEKVMVVH